MKTAIAVLTGVTVTAAAQVTSNIAAASLTTATTNYFAIQATVTNSANYQKLANRLYIRYAFAMTDESASIGKLAAQGTLEVHVPKEASAIKIVVSDKLPICGLYLHVWVDHEEMTASSTLTVQAIV